MTLGKNDSLLASNMDPAEELDSQEKRPRRKRQRRDLLESRSRQKRIKGRYIILEKWIGERITIILLVILLVALLIWTVFHHNYAVVSLPPIPYEE